MCGPYFALGFDCASLCCFGFLLLHGGMYCWFRVLITMIVQGRIALSVLCSIFGFYQLKGVVYFWGLHFSIKAPCFCCILYQQSFNASPSTIPIARPSGESVDGPPLPGYSGNLWMARHCQAIRGWPGSLVGPEQIPPLPPTPPSPQRRPRTPPRLPPRPPPPPPGRLGSRLQETRGP